MLLALMTLLAPAHAQDVPFAGTTDAPEERVAEESTTNLSAELGGMWTSGNASAYVLTGAAQFGRRWKANQFSAAAGANLGAAVPDADGNGFLDDDERDVGFVRNSRRVQGEARYDRFLSDRDSIYVLAGAFHDTFAGFDLRSHEQVGYSRLFVNEEKSQVRGEIGLDYAQEWRTTPEFANILAARVLVGASHQFNENVGIADTFEIYENFLDLEDVRILNTATFTSTLSSQFSLKLSHALIFDNVPVEGFRKLDQTTAITLVATLL